MELRRWGEKNIPGHWSSISLVCLDDGEIAHLMKGRGRRWEAR